MDAATLDPQTLTPFFAPRGVALIGASANPRKLGHAIWRNLTQSGYAGPVYPVNPRYQTLGGMPCYADVSTVPDPVDLAVIILPAPHTPAAVEACGQRGLKAAVIISGGFKEVGPEGAALEAECVALARRYGLRLMGPNGIGTVDLTTGLNTTFLRGLPEPGRIAFVSQSGAVCGGVVDYARGQQLGFSHLVSLGNEADVTETDLLAYLADAPQAGVIAAYVEAITDGRRFMQVARQITPAKPIVLLKAGQTEAGDRAVSSHTGSLAGAHAAYSAACAQSGVIEAGTVGQLLDIARGLTCPVLPAGSRVAIVTNAGGPAVLAADSLARSGLSLPELVAETQAALRGKLVPSAQVFNPVDMLGGAEPADYAFAVQTALTDQAVEAVVAIHVPQALVKPAAVAAALAEVADGAAKPLLVCLMGDDSVVGARRLLHQQRVPVYTFPEVVGPVLQAMNRYRAWRESAPEGLPALRVDTAAAAALLPAQAGPLAEAAARPVLAAYGLPLIPAEVARTPAAAAQAAARLGFPVALKIVSPDIIHKSEAGGITLNLSDAAAVEAAFRQLRQAAAAAQPQARLTGALVQPMAPPGPEIIIGLRRDPQFGPLLMVGLGGIYVELLTDVAFRVAPVSRTEARAMLAETRAGRLLAGLRGQPAADREAVVDALLRLGQLALDFPQIAEVEINPLRVLPQGQGALALDARIILE